MKYTPTFEPQAVVINTDGARTFKNILNMQYFATLETAMEMMQRFGADHISEIVAPGAGGGSGGPVTTDAPPERILVWKDGLEMNAGIMAAYYVRNPDDEFPGLAEKFIAALIKAGREDMQARAQQDS